jgi:hypothetical protein
MLTVRSFDDRTRQRRQDQSLFDTLTVVGTLIVGLITGASNSSTEFAGVSDPKGLEFFIIVLHSVAEYAGFNQVVICLAQLTFNAIYDVDCYNIFIPVFSLTVSLGAFFLRGALGWALYCFGKPLMIFLSQGAMSAKKVNQDMVTAITNALMNVLYNETIIEATNITAYEGPFGQYTTTYFVAFGVPLYLFLFILPLEILYIWNLTRRKAALTEKMRRMMQAKYKTQSEQMKDNAETAKRGGVILRRQQLHTHIRSRS